MSSEPKFLSTNSHVVASSPCVDFNRTRCTDTQDGRESGVCASSGAMVAPSVARISTEECVVRIRKVGARV